MLFFKSQGEIHKNMFSFKFTWSSKQVKNVLHIDGSEIPKIWYLVYTFTYLYLSSLRAPPKPLPLHLGCHQAHHQMFQNCANPTQQFLTKAQALHSLFQQPIKVLVQDREERHHWPSPLCHFSKSKHCDRTRKPNEHLNAYKYIQNGNTFFPKERSSFLLCYALALLKGLWQKKNTLLRSHWVYLTCQ